MIPSTLILTAFAAISTLKPSPFYTIVLQPTLTTFLNEFRPNRAIAVFNNCLARLQYPIEDWSGECLVPRVDCSAFTPSHIGALLQPIARKTSTAVESTPVTASWKQQLAGLFAFNVQFGLGLKSYIALALLCLVAIVAVIFVLKELAYRVKYLSRALGEYEYHATRLERIIVDLKTSVSYKAHENMQLHATLMDKRAECQLVREQRDDLLVTVTNLETELEAAAQPPPVTTEVACQVELPETATVTQHTQDSVTTPSPPSQTPEATQSGSRETIARLSEHWEGKVSYLDNTISHLRRQAKRADEVQKHLTGIISQLRENNTKSRSQASFLIEEKQKELSVKKDLERANVKLEHALAKAEKSEERRSKFLERVLARSKDSEKHARHLLDEEQIASGALRLKLAGVSLQAELVEAEKVKVKSLEEQLEATRLELQSTKAENEKLLESFDIKDREVSDQASSSKQELENGHRDFANLQVLYDWEKKCLLDHEEGLFESLEREFVLKVILEKEMEKREEFRQAADEAIRSLADQANKLAEADTSIDTLQAQVTALTSERDELIQARVTSNQETLEAEARHEAAVEEAQKLVAEVNGLRELLENREVSAAERKPQASIPSPSTPTETREAETRSLTGQHDDPLQTQTAADEQRSQAKMREEAALEEIARLILENDALRDCLEEMHSDAIKRETVEAKKPSTTRVKGPVQARLEKENNALKASQSELSSDIARVCAENNDLAETVDLLQTRERLLQDRLDDLERQRANEERDRTKLVAELDGVYKRADQLEDDLQQTAEDLQQSRVKESRARSELSTAKTTVTKLQNAANRFKATVERQGNDLFELKHSPTSPTFASADPSTSSASSSSRSFVHPESKGFRGLMTPNDTPTVPASKRRAVPSALGSHGTGNAGKPQAEEEDVDSPQRAAWIGKGPQVLKATGLGDRLAQPRFEDLPPLPSPPSPERFFSH